MQCPALYGERGLIRVFENDFVIVKIVKYENVESENQIYLCISVRIADAEQDERPDR